MRICILIFLVFVSFVFSQMIPPNQLATLMRYHKECQRKTGISDNVAMGIAAGKFPNDPVLQNHLFCIHQKLGFQDQNGNLQKSVIASTIQLALPTSMNAQDMVDTCAVQSGSPGQTALDMDRCMFGMIRGSQG
ncbi:uncharacterized protein [Leptinotarsa decemlineata]|uniref:uncharacterized protein n=1 Tax=Leptinotarsa decemlineata TaxID=7539 RepID=UPI003D306F26